MNLDEGKSMNLKKSQNNRTCLRSIQTIFVENCMNMKWHTKSLGRASECEPFP